MVGTDPGDSTGRRPDDLGGPDATVRATARALAKVDDAASLVLVEGLLDEIALRTAAEARGRDLDAERVVLVPIGGAHAISRFLGDLGPLATRVRLAGLCDLREAELFRRAVAAHVGSELTRADMERLGFHVCDRDLEDELIRALGMEEVQALFEAQGDLGLFHQFQSQPAWRGRPVQAQTYRFVRSSGSRNLRYTRLFVEAAVALGRLPRPLDALLTAV
ncbi:ATP-dependent endonuclease [Catellatospora sp. KI3]|uniref:TOPRIM nucleotidyl transferase/hydrolase domain-containing protein n=1 Tax=Catellatospora sp. KI3 TaxID=3041620 RepID=UPI00248230D9|nr:TOPRIM nucleotidyl transferase/hydrolase domain-containing protein [Catellatospora sp. KI3]MDI1461151.1 ATP-dependent endonuclease [Catellatospora sp. KI3]